MRAAVGVRTAGDSSASGPRQETLFDFLSGTGLPLVTGLVAMVRWSAFGLALAGTAYGLSCLVFVEDGLWTPELAWAGALPALATAPFYVWSFRLAGRRRMQQAALLLFAALYLLSLLATWPRGAFSPAWYLQPVLSLLSTCCLGLVPGLSMTLVAVTVLMLAPFAGEEVLLPEAVGADLWAHVTSLGAVTLASGLTGAWIHKVLIAALFAAEMQRRKNLHSTKALRYREKLLRHAMRVETVGDLAGLVSHQLRNAFQVMLGHVALADGGDEDAMARLTRIGDTLERTRPLLDELMLLAHPDEGRTELVDLDAEVRRFHDIASRVLPAAVTLELESSGHALPALLNPRGLEHALWNLLINARQAMPEGGRIRIGTAGTEDRAVVWVTDTGCGIPAAIVDRIFDPYFTTKPAGQGTGLGLAAVDRFVRSCNGEVSVQSAPGQGATFRLAFPLAVAPLDARSA